MAPIQEKVQVIEVIWSLGLDKAPRLDGFSIQFFRAFWHLIKIDLCLIFNYTKFKEKIGGGTNSSFLVLVPKETKPSDVFRCRPISLCKYAYKILTKIIVIGIKKGPSYILLRESRRIHLEETNIGQYHINTGSSTFK